MDGSAGVERLIQEPEMQTSMAMNLLMVRRWDAAKEALRGAAREVCYPCWIDRAYPLVTPIPGAEVQKHHDLNPRVMLTGVLRLRAIQPRSYWGSELASSWPVFRGKVRWRQRGNTAPMLGIPFKTRRFANVSG